MERISQASGGANDMKAKEMHKKIVNALRVAKDESENDEHEAAEAILGEVLDEMLPELGRMLDLLETAAHTPT